jgi:hypothetical protein
VTAFRLGALTTATRLRSERTPLVLGLSVLLAALFAYLERRAGGVTAVDRALTRDTFGLLLPLMSYLTFQRATRGGRLDGSVRTVARHGADGQSAWLGAALPPIATLMLLGMAFAMATVSAAHGRGDPALFRDLWQSTWIGALAGLAYGAWFALGSDFGRFGAGRKWVLLLDLVLGGTSGTFAVPWPRAHIQNLLGAEPLLGLGQGTALAMLLASTLSVLLVALRRAPR